MSIELVTLILFVALILVLFSGLPLAFALGGLALISSYFLWGPKSMLLIAVQSWGVMNSYFLVAIPLYIFMANLLQRSGIIEDLFTVMRIWFGPLRGGLAIGTIVICTLMAAMTGVVGAAVATMGILALPAMLNRKYDKRIALGAICGGRDVGHPYSAQCDHHCVCRYRRGVHRPYVYGRHLSGHSPERLVYYLCGGPGAGCNRNSVRRRRLRNAGNTSWLTSL
jgi:hypothetical protein